MHVDRCPRSYTLRRRSPEGSWSWFVEPRCVSLVTRLVTSRIVTLVALNAAAVMRG